MCNIDAAWWEWTTAARQKKTTTRTLKKKIMNGFISRSWFWQKTWHENKQKDKMDIAGWTVILFCSRFTNNWGEQRLWRTSKKKKDHMCSLKTPMQQFQCLASFSFDFVTFPVCPNQCPVFVFFGWFYFLKADAGSTAAEKFCAHTQKFKSRRRFHRQIVTRGSTWSCWEWISHGDSRGWVIAQSKFCIDPVAQCWYEGGNVALQRATATRCHVTFTA